jgi:hypothetical protein
LTETNWVLPFITKTASVNSDLSFSAELSCVVCLAEAQRRKASFLRDRSEKTMFIAKIYYPFWLIPNASTSILIDGLNSAPYTFSFHLPIKTEAFLEVINQNATDPQKLLTVLQDQSKDTTSPVNLSLSALVTNKELLAFLPAFFKSPLTQQGGMPENALIPPEVNEKTAYETANAYNRALRIMNADVKGLETAIATLKEQLAFYKTVVENEAQAVQQKSEVAVAAVKPKVDKAVKKLVQKHDKVIATLQKVSDRKIASLDKKRETYIRKLAVAEQKRNALLNKIEAAKKKKSSSRSKSSAGTFALKKYERDIDGDKTEIKALADEVEALKKETTRLLKAKDAEFEAAVGQEQVKITQIISAADAKVAAKALLMKTLSSEAIKIINHFESVADGLKRSAATLKSQVEVGYSPDDPEMAVLVQVPVYLVKFSKDEETRYSLISPVTISQDASMLGELKNFLKRNSDPKLTNQIHPASKALDETLNASVIGKLENDPDFEIKLNHLCRSGNFIDQDTFAQTLNEGLDEIQKQGYISEEEASALCRHVVEE